MTMKHTKCYCPGYPRPQLVRKNWLSLDGEWDFCETDAQDDRSAGFSGEKILVPFAPETPKSGVGRKIEKPCVWYSRKVDLGKIEGRAHLVFEGVDYRCDVWVNGRHAGSHVGAYARFSIDVTPYLKEGENVVAVRAYDDASCERPRGKQGWLDHTYGCWYVPTTGIYKSVWLDYSGESYIESVKLTPHLDDYTLSLDFTAGGDTGDLMLEAEITFDGKPVRTAACSVEPGLNSLRVALCSREVDFKVELWHPDRPLLYDVELRLQKGGETIDRAGSYFGLRECRTNGDKIMLNGNPIFLRMLLDQGYWPDSHLTPPDETALETDVRLAKQLGYNGVRKHEKTEDERFFYWADVLGLMVWCEMPSAYRFSDAMIGASMTEWHEIVTQFYSHPSVVSWVVCNESWGIPNVAASPIQQSYTQALYYLTKSLDPVRPVVSNDGWEHTKSDILTIHDYQQCADVLARLYPDAARSGAGSCRNGQRLPFANGFRYGGQPVVFSEYGGTALKSDCDTGWGYGEGAEDCDAFLLRFGSLLRVFKDMDFCSGYCYTQLTDVQQEVNGLLTADRTPKLPPEKIAKLLLE